MSIKKISFTAALLATTLIAPLLFNSANAKDIAIYRWIDKDNIVHFSQNLPQGFDYTELSTVSSFKALSKAERQALADEDKATQAVAEMEKQQDDITAKNKATFEKNCKAARLNIKMLNSLDDIHINEEQSDGSIGSRPLTAAEKEDKLTLSKKHEGLYCSK
ncbi:DUF4124 domain-containing protein [Colwellia psychrerythraea]|uniref:Uncharacterized protein n=1 Tax=Colwellia psychrerythraea TaxID=28229 RepID=A0A099KHX9_COLPS|nr:DUF4124 domain-containing protein [Colwellia psychrerythraea]KGJ89198.1 protein of unknown function DUF4124 [Colwellia psychrerythraea]